MIAEVIRFALSNFTLTCLVITIIVAVVSLTLGSRWGSKPAVIDAFFSYYLLFCIGVSFLYNFVVHVFYGQMAATFIGWAPSPFQTEVGFASLGFGVLGILARWQGLGFRAATVLGPAFFLWGAAGVHIYAMITTHNFAPGNAGFVFWTDLLTPLLGLILIFLQSRHPARA
jgi:hypothetical protein